jgi:hypothetical protein
VFGDVVDWRSGIAREARAILSPLGIEIDWNAFADAWRDQYQPAMDEVRTGRLPSANSMRCIAETSTSILKNLGLDHVGDRDRRESEPCLASARRLAGRDAKG